MSKARINEIAYINFVKAIAMIMVVYCHSCFQVHRVDMPLIISSTLCFAGVPLFFMANGALLLSNPRFDLIKFLKKVLNIFVVCIIWTILIGIVQNAEYHNDFVITPQSVFNYIFKGEGNITNSGHIWFMRSLFSIYVIFPALKKAFDEYYKYFCVLIFFIFITVFFVTTFNTVSGVFLKDTIKLDFSKWTPFSNSSDYCLFYFCIGGVLHKKYYLNKEKHLL